jgi:hypothetical protein
VLNAAETGLVYTVTTVLEIGTSILNVKSVLETLLCQIVSYVLMVGQERTVTMAVLMVTSRIVDAYAMLASMVENQMVFVTRTYALQDATCVIHR